jgi:FtsZ-binding cell division protein ZapB
LREDNKKIHAETKELREENKQLFEDNKQLFEENKQLREDNKKLKDEMKIMGKRQQALLAVLAPMQDVQVRSFIELLAHQAKITTKNREEMRRRTAIVWAKRIPFKGDQIKDAFR